MISMIIIYTRRFGINMDGAVTLKNEKLAAFELVHQCNKLASTSLISICVPMIAILVIMICYLFSDRSMLLDVVVVVVFL